MPLQREVFEDDIAGLQIWVSLMFTLQLITFSVTILCKTEWKQVGMHKGSAVAYYY